MPEAEKSSKNKVSTIDNYLSFSYLSNKISEQYIWISRTTGRQMSINIRQLQLKDCSQVSLVEKVNFKGNADVQDFIS